MLQYEVMVKNRLWRMKENVKGALHDFFTDEAGDTNMISIIIILVIVIGLAAIFRKNITNLVTQMWTAISGSVSSGELNQGVTAGEGTF